MNYGMKKMGMKAKPRSYAKDTTGADRKSVV